MTRTSKRLCVVEDDPDLREALVDFFDGRETWQAVPHQSVENARDEHANAPFDAFLLDLNLPGDDGLTLLRELRSRGDTTVVLIVTARGTEDQRIEGLEAGADDYLVKPFSVRELSARLDAVLRRTTDGFDSVRLGSSQIDFARLEGEGPRGAFRLLAKEAELLNHLLQRRGQVCSREDLLGEVWGFDKAPTTRTVDTHVFQLRQKIEEDPKQPSILLTVHGVGYRLAAE
ncbi:MAG: response regulator transcription factor [Planctomycetota bacterium]